MPNIIIINNTNEDISIEIIKCPQDEDLEEDTILGDDRYDSVTIEANSEINISLDCTQLAWRRFGEWEVTNQNVIFNP